MTATLGPVIDLHRLQATLRGEVRTDEYTLHMYSRDASMYAVKPLAVAFPQTAADVSAAIGFAAEAGVAVMPRGAGTSLAGQTVGEAIVLDCSRHLRRIVAIDKDARIARVEPGVVQDHLNRSVAANGLMFGADTSTSSRATLGGMIGNNSSGTHSVRYGTTVDHVRRLDVVLADGTPAHFGPVRDPLSAAHATASALESQIYRRLPALAAEHREAIARDYPRLWRHAGGYRLGQLVRDAPALDLAKFVVGSEGTLVVVTQAELDLVERPPAQAMAVGHFTSTLAAVAATGDALSLGASAVELLDRTILDLSRSKREYAALSTMLEGDPEALLFVTFFADSEAEAAAEVDELVRTWRRHGHGYHTLRAVSPGDRGALLKVRKAGLGLLMAASRGPRRPLAFVEDTAVEPEHLEEYVRRFAEILTSHDMRAGFYGHCSVGCLHIRPFIDLTHQQERTAMREVAEAVLELVIEYGGVNSSEHGDGLARSEFNQRFFGSELYECMRDVKRVFDPRGTLNPGKIVDGPPLTDDLRDASTGMAPELATRRSFATHGGMRAAADRCMNIGACRKTGDGTMCPSYMATREEEHATRGRANALFYALSQPNPREALGDRRLFEILDLCLECKACKSECPLSVDMASLKSEFLACYQDVHGLPLRSRMFSEIRRVNALGAALAPAANAAVRSNVARWALERLGGISARRQLPRYERETVMRWNARRVRPRSGHRGPVVFIADSFTSYTEPGVAKAGIELLECAGWSVVLQDGGCCGRASISKGRLDHARELASMMVERLAPFARSGVAVTGCEPSCLLTLADEYPDLLNQDDAVTAVTARVAPIADLLLEAIRAGDLTLTQRSSVSGRRILVHAHCHEKAVTGSKATVDLLRQIPGATVEEIDIGCCGMAGSFGFEAEHYDLSIAIAKQRLVPTLAAAPEDVLVAATGVSCRQQIAHTTNRVAKHPLELVREAVAMPWSRRSP